MSMSADHDSASASDHVPTVAMAVVALTAFGIALGMTVFAITMPAIRGLGVTASPSKGFDGDPL